MKTPEKLKLMDVSEVQMIAKAMTELKQMVQAEVADTEDYDGESDHILELINLMEEELNAIKKSGTRTNRQELKLLAYSTLMDLFLAGDMDDDLEDDEEWKDDELEDGEWEEN